MKKSFKILGLAVFFVPIVALAATYMHETSVAQGQTVQGNLYLAGSNPTMAGTVNGDLLMAGGTVNVSGNVGADAMLAGGNVNVTGPIGGDLRAAGGSLVVNTRVNGEAVLFGGDITVGPQAVIAGDLVANGGKVSVDPAAQITGNKYIQNGEEEAKKQQETAKTNFWGYYIVPEIFALLGLLLAAAFFSIFYQGAWAERVINSGIGRGSFWKMLGLGFVLLILSPIAIVLLLFTGIGAFLGIILMLAYITLILVSIVFGGMIFAGLLQSRYEKEPYVKFQWGWLLGGVIISHLLTLIPLVGWLFGLVFFLVAMGTIISMKWRANLEVPAPATKPKKIR
jgi:cytoskeletal protein CcmA (bactofilin family)